MGPSKNLFHKNRSSHSLLNTQDANDKHSYRPSPAESPLHSPAFPPPPSSDYDDDDRQDQNYPPQHRPEEARAHPSGQPTRSQSQRSPTSINTNQPRITVGLSTPKSAIDEPPDRYSRPPPPQVQSHQKEDGKKRRFFGLRSAKETASATSGIPARNISVRRKNPLHEVPPDAGQHTSPQYWSSTHVSPTDDDDDELEEAGSGLHLSHSQSVPPPDKDPLRSPAYPPPISHHEYSHGKHFKESTNTSQTNRNPLDRQGSHQSAWERAPKQAQQQQQYTHPDAGQIPTQTSPSYNPSSVSAHSTSSSHHPFHRTSPSEALHQHWQEQPSRPSSQQSLEPPNPTQTPRTSDTHHVRSSSSQVSSASYMQGSMGPPPPQQQQQQQQSQPQTQQPSQSRRSSEAQQSQPGGQSREGAGYHPYGQNIQGAVLPSNAPPQYSGQLAPQGQNFRSTAQPSPMQQGNSDQGRGTTPPPSRSRDDLSSMDVAQLLARHDELQDKYRKVKKYYFDKDAQVQQLQNTLAHQRLAQSRTSLDDNEYSNRFSRLDGAINNLAFNIRREWRQVPLWLAPHVNRDAATNPTKEMTAVGRAAISRWLVDELLDRYFHPALDPVLSTQLKTIEKNLRKFAAPTPSDEEKDALLAKISNWRLSTLDGLQEILALPQAADCRTSLTDSLVEKLVASLSMMLKEPTPPGLEGGVSMIIELAVGIAANLPLESRDVFVEYVTPGQFINESFMKIETGLPALTNPGDGPSEGNDAASLTSKQTEETGSIDSRETGNSNGNEDSLSQQSSQNQQQAQAAGKKKGMFGGFMGSAGSKKGGIGAPPPQSAMGGQGQGQGPKEERVRFSTFMAVEVRGRSVLVKAPVYVRD